MPVKVFELAPTPLNTANDQSASSFYNIRTYQQTNAGGLVLGDAIDLTNFEAANLSNPAIGTLYEGRYRRIQVDANATALNVAKGKAAYVVPGYTLLGALIATPGEGQTPGAYQINGVTPEGGKGSGAIIQVIIGADGTLTAPPTVIAKGADYTLPPTFTLVTGGTVATVTAQMIINSYIVTSRDVVGVNLSQGRGVFLNSITPGNFGWIQEDGIATVQGGATVGSATLGAVVSPFTPTDGTFEAIADATAPLVSAFGTACDVPVASAQYRALLNLPVWNG